MIPLYNPIYHTGSKSFNLEMFHLFHVFNFFLKIKKNKNKIYKNNPELRNIWNILDIIHPRK